MAIPKNDWYTIKSGDTLSEIAKEAGIADWKTIYNDPQNADFRKQRPDPNKIYPGDKIWIPGNPTTSTGKKTVFVAPSVLQASIMYIEADTDILVAYAKTTVTKPHWKEGEVVDDTYTNGSASIDCSKNRRYFHSRIQQPG
ncbi:MAG: LysM peptidoglycan-binding domain-containing protein [Chitinispirillaceae bacterium]|nr:LysM peptidoglycan-binding domain-containing protein [Chitinispirillaceae bacterium]